MGNNSVPKFIFRLSRFPVYRGSILGRFYCKKWSIKNLFCCDHYQKCTTYYFLTCFSNSFSLVFVVITRSCCNLPKQMEGPYLVPLMWYIQRNKESSTLQHQKSTVSPQKLHWNQDITDLRVIKVFPYSLRQNCTQLVGIWFPWWPHTSMNAQKVRVVNRTRFCKGVELVHPLFWYIKLHEARLMMGQFHKLHSSLSQFSSTSTRFPVTAIIVNTPLY